MRKLLVLLHNPTFELVNGTILEDVTEYKYLGLKVDNKLNYKVHVNLIIQNVAGKISNLNRIKKCLSQRAMISIYKSMIIPLFDIGDVFYDSTNATYLKKFQTLQNRAIRIIYRLSSINTDEFHGKLNILQLSDRRKLHITQLAQWLSQIDTLKGKRNLNTRSHAPGRCNLRLEKTNKNIYYKSI